MTFTSLRQGLAAGALTPAEIKIVEGTAKSTISLTIPPNSFQTKFSFVATISMFAAVGLIPIMLLGLFLQFHFAGPDYQLPRRLIAPILLAAATPGFLFGLWFSRKMLNKQYWQLTDTELSCGISRQQRFLLASIEKIFVGLPVDALGKLFQRAQPGTAAGTSVAVLSKLIRWARREVCGWPVPPRKILC